MQVIKKSMALVMMLFLVACSPSVSTVPKQGETESALVLDIRKHYQRHHYEKVIDLVDTMRSQYPYSKHYEQVNIWLIDALYHQGDYEQCVSEADFFRQLFAGSRHNDYVMLLQSYALVAGNHALFSRMFNTDRSGFDQKSYEKASHILQLMIREYPLSQYRNEAFYLLIHIQRLMAKYSSDTGDYYFSHDACLAAIPYYQKVRLHYADTPYLQHVRSRLKTCYQRLGQQEMLAALDTEVVVSQ